MEVKAKSAEEIVQKKLEALSRKNRYQEIISIVTQSVHESIDLQKVLDNAIEAMKKNIDKMGIVSIYLVEGDEVVVKAQTGFTEDYLKRAGRIPYPKGATWKTVLEKKSIYVPDIDQDTILGAAGRDMGVQCFLIVPLFIDEEAVGTIGIVAYEKNVFDEEELKLLEIVSNQISIAIRNAKQAEELKKSEELQKRNVDILLRKGRYQEIISSVTQSVHQSIDLQSVLDNSIQAMIRNIEKLDSIAIYLVEGDEVVLRAHKGFTDDYIKRAGRIAYPKGVTWKTIIEKQSVYVPDVELENSLGPAGKDMGFNCYLIVPLFIDEKVVGTLAIVSYEKNVYDKEELKLLDIVSKQISIAIRNAKQAEALTNSEKRYKTLFQEGPSMYFTVSEEGNVLSVNRNGIERLGYVEEELVGHSVFSVFLDEDKTKIKKQLEQCFANPDQIFKWDIRKVCKNGSVINVRELSRCVISSTGENVAIIACEDITEHKNSENLLLSEKRILELISQDEDLPAILDQICLAVEQQSYQMLCSFCLVDNTGKALVSCAAPNMSEDYAKDIGRLPIGPDIASCGTAAYTKKQVIVSDTSTDPLWTNFKDLAHNHNLQACWSTPILSNSGELLGTFAMYYSKPREPIQWEFDIIERATNLARIAIERKNAEDILNKNLDRLSKKSRYEEIINTVTRNVHSSIELQEVLQNAVDSMNENINHAENVGIFFVEGDFAVNKAFSGYSPKLAEKVKKIPRPKGFTWKTILEGKSLYCSDAEKDPIIGPAGKKEGTKSYASMPVMLRGETIGCIAINAFQKNAFDSEDLNLLDTVAQQIGVAINNASQADALIQSEERYRILFEQSPVGVYLFDRDLKITNCNQRIVEMLQSSYDNIIGYCIRDLKTKNFLDNTEKTLEGKYSYQEDIYEATTSSAKLWLSQYFSPLRDPQGNVIGGMGVVEDITERKQAEELANQLGTILEESLNEVYIADIESLKFIQVNEGARKNLGYTAEELQNMHPVDIKTDLNQKKFKKLVAPLLAGKVEKIRHTSTHQRKDGSIYPVETNLQISTFKGRRVFVANVLDITERELAHSLLLSEKKILEMISQGKELSTVLNEICLEAENQSHEMLCSFLLVDDTGKSLVTSAAPNLPQNYLDETALVPIGPNIGSCGTASHLKEQVIVSDIGTDPLWKDFRDLALRNNLHACWSTPMLSHSGELFGTFAMYYPEPRHPNDRELDIIERATHLARIAIERKNSEDKLQENLDRLYKKSRYEEVINAVSRSIHQSLELDVVFESAVEAISKEIEDAKNVVIFMVEGDINDKENPAFAVMKANRGHSKKYISKVSRIPYPKGATWKTIIDGKKRYVADTDKDKSIGPAGKEFGTKSYISMPLSLGKEAVGCIHIHSSEKDGFSEDDLKLLEIVTRQLETAITNASKAEALKKSEQSLTYNLDQLSKKNRYEEIISTVTSSVHRSIDLDEVLENAADSLHKNVDHSDHVAIYLVEGDNAILKSYKGYPKWFTDKVASIPKPKGFTWKTLIDGVPLFVPDVNKDGIIGPAGRKVGTQSYASMPIKYNYTTIGCINISSRTLNSFDEDEIKLLEIVATQIESAINNANQAEALKVSREELRESREHFRLLVETTNVIPWEYDPKAKRYTYVGPQLEKLLGYPASDWYKDDFWPPLIHEEDREGVLESCTKATLALKDHELEYRMTSKDGKTVWIYEMVSVIAEDGEPKTLRGFMIDITERTLSEYEKREAQERYRALIEHSYEIIVETNINGTLLYINPTFNEILGYKEGELLGRSIFEHINEEDAPSVIAQFSKAINDFKQSTATFRFKNKSGQWQWLESVSSPFTTAGGEVRTVISSRDITERMESEKKLQEAFSEIETLKNKLEKENVYLKKEIELTYSHSDIIGDSKAITSALNKIEQVAATDATVLLTGETGTGKELFANRIHNLSSRKDRAMVKVNCAALPPHLIESELFGHEKGAFTGAVSKNIGRFEVADDSTIFLDEVAELPLELQSKLLRVLQEGEFQRVGSAKTVSVNVRVITASNNQLSEAVSMGKFREDLFYRLNVFPIEIPPLRERKEDIPNLLWFFISEFEKKMDKTIQNISRKDMENLINYPWPGNIRQLRNVIERSMILSSGPDLKIEVPGITSERASSEIKELEEVERDHISYILNMTNWRIRGKSGAAEVLGLKPTTLESRIKRLGIKRGH